MREYVEKMLHTRVEHEPVAISGLPLYLRGLYSLERWTVFGVPLALASPLESQTVKTMVKHRDALEAALGVPVAFALEDATGYRIGRMLETGLPFVEQGGQVYLPFLGPCERPSEGRRRDLFAPGTAPRAHGALQRPRWRQRHPSGRLPRHGEDDRLARIR